MTRPEPVLSLVVLGDPRSQGSKTKHAANGRSWMAEYKATELKNWRDKVGFLAWQALREAGIREPLELVIVGAEFVFPWPKNFFRTHHGQPTRERTEWSRSRFYARGGKDVDTLQRAVGDAFQSAGVVRHDGGIVAWAGPPGSWEGPRKVYGDILGARLWVYDALAVEALRASPVGPTETKSPEEGPAQEILAGAAGG